jgi:succinate-semialdehyde dehydrogenase / glutarate-semialdehyde dehydrogenase
MSTTDIDRGARVVDERLADVPPLLFVDGVWRPTASGETFPVRDPATDDVLAFVPNGTAEDATAAVAAAKRALPTWRATTAAERSGLLRKFFDLIVERREWLALIMSLEEGKPVAEALGELAYGAAFIEWAAEEAKRVEGDILPASHTAKRILVLRQGVGVTASITPWNFPLAMITRKLGPALAAGCTQVIKPAGETPLTAMALCLLADEAGLPAGTVNLVTGPAAPIAETWFADPAVRKVSFTGSTEVGQRLIVQSAQHVTRLSLELGGHAPVIVFPDVDVEEAARVAVAGKYRNSGQSCISPNRYYVHDDIYDDFVERFASLSAALSLGPGTLPGVELGPLINDRAVAKATEHIDDAVGRGAKILTGGGTRNLGEGFTDRFFEPTVLTDVDHDARVCHEETFAPVAPFVRFRDEHDAVRMANDTVYGLASYCFTRDVGRVIRVAEALEYGIVGVNDCLPSTAQAPFGGVKQSGLGREGGHYVMDEYTEVKYVSLAI